MKKPFPLISVVIATYDCERTIEKCLLSIRNQTYPNIEIIVVDSLYYDKEKQERCKKIIKKYAKYFQDGPERSIQRNRGIKEAKGEYILIVDQDMYLTPGVIEESYKTLQNQDYIALMVPEISIGEGYWTKCVILERYVSLYLQDGTNECCRFFRKKDALAIGGYDPAVVGMEDADFHYRMGKQGKIGKIKNNRINHDEGRVQFFARVKKMYYYSKSSKNYVKRNSIRAATRFFPIKPAYFKHWRVLAKNPKVTVGMFTLKIAETIAGGLGFLKG